MLVRKVAGGEKLDLKAFLENLPLWKGLKIQAEDKNHRGDAKAQHDRILKALQQKVLHLIRALALIHPVMVEAG